MSYEQATSDSDSENLGSNPSPPANGNSDVSGISGPESGPDKADKAERTAHSGRTEPGTGMPNKRYLESLDAGEITRKLKESLASRPMTIAEAAGFLARVHTVEVENERGFAIDWSTPNFVEVDGDLYWEAWRVIREIGAL